MWKNLQGYIQTTRCQYIRSRRLLDQHLNSKWTLCMHYYNKSFMMCVYLYICRQETWPCPPLPADGGTPTHPLMPTMEWQTEDNELQQFLKEIVKINNEGE